MQNRMPSGLFVVLILITKILGDDPTSDEGSPESPLQIDPKWEKFNYNYNGLYKVVPPTPIPSNYTQQDGTLDMEKAEQAADLHQDGFRWASRIECNDFLREFLKTEFFSPLGNQAYFADASEGLTNNSTDSLCIRQRLLYTKPHSHDSGLRIQDSEFDIACGLEKRNSRIQCDCDINQKQERLRFYCEGELEPLWTDCQTTVVFIYLYDTWKNRSNPSEVQAAVGAWVAFSKRQVIDNATKTIILDKIKSWGFDGENAVVSNYAKCPKTKITVKSKKEKGKKREPHGEGKDA